MAAEDPTTSERWATIARFPNYEVSDFGQVRSYWRRSSVKGRQGITTWVAQEPRLLKPHITPRGYVAAILVDIDGKVRTCQVHRLVLEAFVGPCPEGHEGCHRDGSRTNNRLSNLYWGTRKQNCLDTNSHGRNRNAKLSQAEIDEAIQLRREGWTLKQLAERYGVIIPSIHRLLRSRGVAEDSRKNRGQATRDAVMALHLAGMRSKDIQKRLGICKGTVHRAIYGPPG